MNPELRELYQEVILSHSKRPHNFGDLPDATGSSEGYNPLCGDRVKVFVKEENGQITSIRFQGVGCAISQASASLMTDAVQGKSVSEAEAMFESFHRMLTQGDTPADFEDTDLAALAGVHEHPVRIKCAALAWHAAKAALHGENSTSTE